MKFDITQRFDAAPTDVAAVYLDESFIAEGNGPGARITYIETLRHDVDDHLAVLYVRYRFVAHLPAAARAILSPDKLTWVEETVVDRDSGISDVTIRPDHYADRLRAAARITLSPDGDGSIRRATGEVKVAALLVGGQVEKAIVSGMAEHLAAEAERAAVALR